MRLYGKKKGPPGRLSDDTIIVDIEGEWEMEYKLDRVKQILEQVSVRDVVWGGGWVQGAPGMTADWGRGGAQRDDTSAALPPPPTQFT